MTLLSVSKRSRRVDRRLAFSVLLALAAVAPLFSGDYVRYLAFTFCIVATMGQAWNLLAGYCGMLSIGSQLYIGGGGFCVALSTYYAGLSAWAALPLACLTGAVLASLQALPFEGARRRWRHVVAIAAVLLWAVYEGAILLRPSLDVFGGAYSRRLMIALAIFSWELPLLKLDGAYFSVATWLLAAAAGSTMAQWSVSGAGAGMRIVTDADLIRLYVAALSILIASTLAMTLLLYSRFGPALTAIRDDAAAAAAVGIDIHRIKAAAYVAAGALMSVSGALYFMNATVVTPDAGFGISWSAIVIFATVIGGMGTLAGPLAGAAFYVLVDQVLGQRLGSGLLMLGLASIASILAMPRGIVGTLSSRFAETPRGEDTLAAATESQG